MSSRSFPPFAVYAAGLIGIGVLNLVYRDFALEWQPVPAWVSGREMLALLSGVVLVLAGTGLFAARLRSTAAAVLTAYLVLWVLLLQVPRTAAAPLNIGVVLGLAESTALLTGILIVLASEHGSANGVRAGRILFGLACLVFGLSHLVYAKITASMVPAWMPERLDIAYLTGAGHFAAGLGILSGVLSRLAATLEAVMMSLFVLLLHIPGVLAAPTDRLQWTELCVATALTGAAWIVAWSLRERPWGLHA
jgi:uncharacterized membrane protein